MKTKHKIKAFTLSEMIVVIILTSIVVGMAFSVLTLVQKHMFAIKNNFNKNTELNKIEQSLCLDFNRFSKIEYNNMEEELRFTSEIDSITYKFMADYILKGVDTFKVQLQHKSFFFNGNKTLNGQIDAIKMETTKSFQNQLLFISKTNDATLFLD